MVSQQAARFSALMKKPLLLILTICAVNVGFCNPTGGTVTNGNATISRNGNSTIIQQKSKQTVIEWKTFNIGKGESTHFQQVAGGIALNRIDGNQGMSQIFGILSATGKIILVNPAGIYFGTGSVINVGGMIASTANISNANFLAGKYIFDQPSPFPNASIINEGSIRASDYGLIALIGGTVTNHGLIQAELGNIVLATGNKFTFDFYGDQLINFSVDAPVAAGGKITNTGTMLADGGKIIVSAQAAQGVLDNVIDMEGVAQARSVSQKDGQIILLASSGGIKVGGKLITDSRDHGTKGGTITVKASKVTITSTGILSANGDKGGGDINIISDEAKIAGKILAQGAGNNTLGGNINITASNLDFNHALVNASGNGGGGKITMAAPADTDSSHTYINVDSGTSILADAIISGKGGDISIASDQVTVAGTLSATGSGSGTYGGAIKILANEIQIAPHAVLTVRGDIGGGNVLLAGKADQNGNPTNASYINVSAFSSIVADAVSSGTAGNIAFYGDNVSIAGTVSVVGLGAGTMGGNIGVYGNNIAVLPGAFVTAAAQFAGGLIIIGTNPYSSTSDTSSNSVTVALGSEIAASVSGQDGVGGTIKIASNNTEIAGNLDVSGKNTDSSGGVLQLTGTNIDIQPMASLDASGYKAGGQIIVGSIDTSIVNVDKDSVLNAQGLGTNANGGLIQLYATNTNVLGTLNVSAADANGSGGVVKVLAQDTVTIGASANILAMGDSAGGQVFIGGDQHGAGVDPNAQHTEVAVGSVINASALTTGSGGTVVVWSDIDTHFAGTIKANGGIYGGNGGEAEVSSKNQLAYDGKVDLRASQGATGTLTLDPQNLTIQNNPGGNANNSVITVAALEDALLTANVLIVTGKNGNAAGDITVANDISWNNTNKLTLSAFRDIDVNAKITNNAGGSLVLNADNTRDGEGTINFNNNGHVTMTGGGQVVLNYEPNNDNFRNPNIYSQNVTVGGGTTVAYNALNTVTPAENEAIISSFFVLPNILLNMSLASLQDDVDVIIPTDDRVIVALDNSLETITETAPGLAIKVMDAPADSANCNKASCVSNDFVIE